jgi:threonine dehydrogenase-like Zn-dependent dehydrogenase
MKAIVLEAPKTITLLDLPTPERKSTEVLIAPVTVGICGTDVSVYRGNLPVQYPLILGHEYCAEIVDVGSNVYGLKRNDIVIL